MNVLVIDVGGTNVKARVWGRSEKIKFRSGKRMTARRFTRTILEMTEGWKYDAVSIGIPAPVIQGRIVENPMNLGAGWVRFNFSKAFNKPVKIINDAAMQALGSYHSGRMLFIGLGTGLGSALILDEVIVPLELGELRYNGSKLGKVLGRKAARRNRHLWQKRVHAIVTSFAEAFRADCIVIGGGNVKLLRKLPEDAKAGSNEKAFLGGARLWGGGSIRAKPKKHTWVIT